VGFGLTSGPPGDLSEVLLEVNLMYVPNNVCQQPYQQNPLFSSVVISDTMMCAGYPVGQPIAAS
jgi:hypothetical protein